MVQDYVLMRDDIVKSMFTNPRTGKKFSASIIAHTIGADEEEIYNNLEYVHPLIRENANTVKSEADTVYETDKTLINIEFNKSSGNRTFTKNQAYICQLYLRQLPTDKSYEFLKPIIQINIDGYDYFNGNKFIYHSMLMETSLHIVENRNIEIYHINLPYLRLIDYNKVRSDEDRLEKLLYILVCDDSERLDKLYEGDELMKEVRNEIKRDIAALDAWLYYDKEELERLDREDAIKEGKIKGLEEGRELGLQEGRELGLQEGHELGLQEGREEKTVEIVKKLLNKNISLEIISETTGLSLEEVNKVKEEK